MVGLALMAATVQLPAVTCIVSNTRSEKACTLGCCANKTCCETSSERTGPPIPPLAKTSPDQQNVSAIAAIVGAALATPFATGSLVFRPSTEGRAHSPPPLALICIRLI